MDRAGRESDDALRAQRSEDIRGALRSGRLNCCQHLCDGAETAWRHAERVDAVVDLVIDGRVINAIAAANHRLAARAPREAAARPNLFVIGGQRGAPVIDLITQTGIDRQGRRGAPLILNKARVQRVRGAHHAVAKALLIALRQPQVERLQGVDGGGSQCGIHQPSGQRAERETPAEEGRRIGMLAPDQRIGAGPQVWRPRLKVRLSESSGRREMLSLGRNRSRLKLPKPASSSAGPNFSFVPVS